MIEIQGMSLLLTDMCNASCRHCGISAGLDRKGVMTAEKAKEYLDVLGRLPGAKLVSYTGGEPFLFYDLLTEIIAYAYRLGLSGEIVTNSYWATDAGKAEKMLLPLTDAGVVNFVTSLDDFHAEYIDPAYVKNAVRAACKLGCNVTVKVMVCPNSTYSHDHVREFLDTGGSRIKYISQRPVFVGRAAKELNAAEIRAGDDGKEADGKCPIVIKFPAISPSGEVYPCCGFGPGYRLAGNANTQDLEEILPKMQSNLFFNLLSIMGPVNIIRRARKYMNKDPRTDFFSTCEACNYIIEDKDVCFAVTRLLNDIAATPGQQDS